MAPPNPGTKLAIACHPLCQFSPDTIGEEKANVLKSLREGGMGQGRFTIAASELLGRPVVKTSVSRHFHHYREAEEQAAPSAEVEGGKATDLQILDGVIEAAYRNRKNWKPTLGDALKAMEMKHRLTGNSAFEDVMEAMEKGLRFAEGGDGDEEAETTAQEAPEAVLSPAERPEEDEELPKPVY